MSTNNLALFQALGAKMDYLNQRQRVVAQNIANSDTTGYVPQDLEEVNFGKIVKNITKSSNSIGMKTTNVSHFPPPNTVPPPRAGEQRETYEVAPSGNAVVLEEQLIKAGRNSMDYNLITNLYQKNVNMLRTAIGRGR